MISLLFLFVVLLVAGLFFILADVLKLPTMGAAKAMLSAGKQDKKAAKPWMRISCPALSGCQDLFAWMSTAKAACPTSSKRRASV